MKQDIDDSLRNVIESMLEIKAKTDEKDLNPIIHEIQNFIEDKILYYEKLASKMEEDRKKDWDTLNEVFLKNLINSRKSGNNEL